MKLEFVNENSRVCQNKITHNVRQIGEGAAFSTDVE